MPRDPSLPEIMEHRHCESVNVSSVGCRDRNDGTGVRAWRTRTHHEDLLDIGEKEEEVRSYSSASSSA